MFGLEILDVVIGLTFVYLLLALFATALNEYIAAVMNLRGKELAKGLGKLLDDVDDKDILQKAFNAVKSSTAQSSASLTERFYSHRFIRPLATRQGWIARDWPQFWRRSRDPRLPSYIPARTFAMALLDVLGVHDETATLPPSAGEEQPEASASVRTPATGSPGAQPEAPSASTKKTEVSQELRRVLEILKNESPHDVNQALGGLTGLLGNATLPPAAKVRLLATLTETQTRLQNLHDSVEVWFNNGMDRVSGAYKRTAQGWLFLLGLLIALCMNADTIEMWRRLEADDALRNAMVRRAEATVAALDSTLADSAAADTTTEPARTASTPVPVQTESLATTPPQTLGNPAGAARDSTAGDSAKLAAVAQARKNYLATRARLDSMELKLGWTFANLQSIGVFDTARARRDSLGVVRRYSIARAKADSVRAAQRGVNPVPRTAAETQKDSIAAARARSSRWWYGMRPYAPFTHPGPFWAKVLGLLLTALAISLGAPFWFDLLNKVISIRAAGRSPEEKPKSPEGGPKRIAERTPK
jgi:hypothetical protein